MSSMTSHKRMINTMNSDIQTANEDAARVVKKQRVCAERTHEALESLITLMTDMKYKLQTRTDRSGTNLKEELEKLQKRVDGDEFLRSLNKDTRELHSAVSKLGKVKLRPLPKQSTLTPMPHSSSNPTSLRILAWQRATLNSTQAL